MFMTPEPNQGIMRITVRALVTTGVLFSRFFPFWSLGHRCLLDTSPLQEDLSLIHIVGESLSASHSTARSHQHWHRVSCGADGWRHMCSAVSINQAGVCRTLLDRLLASNALTNASRRGLQGCSKSPAVMDALVKVLLIKREPNHKFDSLLDHKLDSVLERPRLVRRFGNSFK